MIGHLLSELPEIDHIRPLQLHRLFLHIMKLLNICYHVSQRTYVTADFHNTDAESGASTNNGIFMCIYIYICVYVHVQFRNIN